METRMSFNSSQAVSEGKFLNDFDFNSCGFIIGIETRKAKIYCEGNVDGRREGSNKEVETPSQIQLNEIN